MSVTYIRTQDDFETELSSLLLGELKLTTEPFPFIHNNQYEKPCLSIDTYECSSESLTPEPRRPLRILMLHGYTQSGEFFRAKTRKLRDHIVERLQDDMWQYDGLEFLYPDAPHHLEASDVPGHEGGSTADEELYGWFNVNEQPFRGLPESIDWLVDYVREAGHIDGVIGFSQGGALGMMLAALCEGSSNPERLGALAKQGFPLHLEPPQTELKFAVAFCGFQGMTQFYKGFYDPIITTPAMCIEADLDIMVSKEISAGLIDSCADVEVLRHRGGHYVPTDRHTMDAVAKFVQGRLSEDMESLSDDDSDWE